MPVFGDGATVTDRANCDGVTVRLDGNGVLMSSTTTSAHASKLAEELICSSGPLLPTDALWRALQFPSSAAFRQAKARGRLHVKVFKIPGRRGTFAFTEDVAEWLRNLDGEEPM
jgi:hypothetical protein